MLKSIVTVVGNIYVLVSMSWKLSCIILVCVPLFMYSSSYCGKAQKNIQKKYQKYLAKITEIAGECFMNIGTVKAFSCEQKEIERFEKKSQTAFNLGWDKSIAVGISNGTEGFVKNIAILCVLWYGGYLVNNHQSLSSGQLTTFLMYTDSLADAAAVISQGIQKIQVASGACERLFQLMDIPPKIVNDHGKKIDQKDFKGLIHFKDVDFRYPGSNVQVLDGFELKIEVTASETRH